MIAQLLTVSAGPNKIACPNIAVTIGGSPTASGGIAPYSYSWSPTTGLSSASIANPTATVNQNITYTVTVRDKKDSVKTAIVSVTMDDFTKLNAGNDTGFCYYQTAGASIGNPFNYANPYTYSWLPINDLSNPNSPQTVATPTATTNYTLTITSPNCGTKTDVVTVSVYNIPVDAGRDTTIIEGSSATLHGTPVDTANLNYWWQPLYNINYPSTASPDVFPKRDTVYYFYVIDQHGCMFSDEVRIEVIPSEIPFFYNTMSPNGDGNNDVFYIGNLEKYIDNKLEIYNRYGQLIYNSTNYLNDWNGTYLGKEVPAGTYFFVFDTRTELGKFKGSITIMR